MGYAHMAYSPNDDEYGDLYIGFVIDGIKSKKEHINLVKTIKELKKNVQIYKDDKDNLIKAKEE